MNKLTVRARLTLVIAGMSLLAVAIAILSLIAIDRANDRLEDFVHGINARAELAVAVRSAVNQRAIGARNLVLLSTPDEMKDEAARISQAHAEVSQKLQQLRSSATSAGAPAAVMERIKVIEEVEAGYGPVALRIVDLTLKGEREAAIRSMHDDCRPRLGALLQAVNAYLDVTHQRAREVIELAEQEYRHQMALLFGLVALAICVGAAMGWVLIRNLSRALGCEPDALNAIALRMADGDFSRVDQHACPPRSVLAALCSLQSNMATIVGQVRQSSDCVSTGSRHIADGSSHLSARTEEQATSLEQTSASMTEIRTTVESNAEVARHANQLAMSASESAGQGGQVMGEVVSTMQEITSSARKVAEIITVIDGIAFQTNILALNAAVESARAGEQGRGFAVVAGEVRTLAQRSAAAAKEIRSLIGNSLERVDSGSRLVQTAGASIDGIVEQVQQVAMLIAQIDASAGEQTRAISHVSDAVHLLDQVTQQNAALVEESASAAESLHHQAAALNDVVGRFRI